MVNKNFFFYASLIFYSAYNYCCMEPGKNTATLQGNYGPFFKAFNPEVNCPCPVTGQDININDLSQEEKIKIFEEHFNSLLPDQKEIFFSSKIKKCNEKQLELSKQNYAHNYYTACFLQLQKASTVPNSDEKEKLLHLIIEAYGNLCYNKEININPQDFWKTLRVQPQMIERQNASSERDVQVKTPLMDMFTTTKDKAELIIKNIEENNELLIKKFTKDAQKQRTYNQTISSEISFLDFAALGLILPYHTGMEATQDLSADFGATHLVYYIDGNKADKKEIINLNNQTAKHIQKTNKMLPAKEKLKPEEKARLTLNQLTKLKEKQNGKN